MLALLEQSVVAGGASVSPLCPSLPGMALTVHLFPERRGLGLGVQENVDSVEMNRMTKNLRRNNQPSDKQDWKFRSKGTNFLKIKY